MFDRFKKQFKNMFYIIMRAAHRKKHTYIMNISDKLNNSYYGFDNVSTSSLPDGDEFYDSEWDDKIPTFPPNSKLILQVRNHRDNRGDDHYPSRSSYKTGFKYTGIILSIIAVVLIVGFLLYRLMKRLDLYTISPERMPSEIQPECHHPNCGQYCTFPQGESSENTIYNSRSSIHTLNVTSGILPSVACISDREVRSAHVNISDLPPSYASSTRNSVESFDSHNDKHDLPPSYNEALNSMSAIEWSKFNNQARRSP